MQSNVIEFELSPDLLNTPSLATPNILSNTASYKSTYNSTHTDYSTTQQSSSTSEPSPITTSTSNSEPSSSSASANAKVSQIEDVLKEGIYETRRPTPSPFEKFVPTPKLPFIVANDDGLATEVPSTADLIIVIESLTDQSATKYVPKPFANGNNASDIIGTVGDNHRYDFSPTPSMGFTPSPKKIFLLRSQSTTEPTSPVQNNHHHVSLSQKSNTESSTVTTQNDLDDESSNDESAHHEFNRRAQDLATINRSIGTHGNHIQQFKSEITNGSEPSLNGQLRTDFNSIHHVIVKQQPTMANNNNNKRTYQQTTAVKMSNETKNIGITTSASSKSNSTLIPQQQPLPNEVTSTHHSSSVKRHKTVSTPNNATITKFGPSSSSSSTSSSPSAATVAATAYSPNGGSDDHRKKQIRDSNREAARRCRERRRQYIEQLEGNLEDAKAQIKQLDDKLAVVERENIQLRAFISETKLPRLSSNESIVDYIHVVTTTGIDLNSDSNHQIDGGTLQRTYINRNNL